MQDGKWNGRCSEVHVNVVSSSESCVERLEVSSHQQKHDFCCQREQHESVTQTLSEKWELSCLTNESVQELTNDNTIEISTLSILYALSSKACWFVGIWWNLLDITRTKFKYLSINWSVINCIPCTINSSHSQIIWCVTGVNPINHFFTVWTWRWTEVRVTKVPCCGIVDIVLGRNNKLLVGFVLEFAWNKSKVIGYHIISKKTTPELCPSNVSISLRHQCQGNQMLFFRTRSSRHQINFSQFISKRNGRNQICTDWNVKHDNCCNWKGELENNESDEWQHLSNLTC